MNAFSQVACRIYQKVLFLAEKVVKIPVPEVKTGKDSLKEVPAYLKEKGLTKPLVVADPFLRKSGKLSLALAPLDEAKIPYEVFEGVKPNPPFASIEEAYSLYQKEGCDCLYTLGGGSSIDTAKAVGGRVANPKKNLAQFKGVLKVKKDLPYLIAAPTTAGTGSEATIASVVVNEKTKDKFSITDPHLVPDLALLDPALLLGMPSSLIASTGMDALTHAIESYIGRSGTKLTKKSAIEAMKLIQKNLYAFYCDPNGESACEAMQQASFLAGVSFTRAYVGYVHALAHALGGYYGVPHGYANAVLLPHVLKAYGKKAEKPLAEIYDALEMGKKENRAEKAAEVIGWVSSLNAAMGIPKAFDSLIQEEDIPALARHAAKEGNPLYPVPKEFNEKELQAILKEVAQ